jgi:hypothetical protein
VGDSRFQIYGESGATGLNQYAGYIQEEILRELQGDRWKRNIREMLSNDGVIGAFLYAIEMIVRQAKWRVDPAADDNEAKAEAAFVWESLQDLSTSWEDTVAEVLSFLPWGFYFPEIVYKRRLGDGRDPRKRSKHTDGRVSWRKFAFRAQDTFPRWEFDDEGGVQGGWQQPPPDYRERFIHIEKALLFRTTTAKNNPEGQSILRRSYRAYYMTTRIENIEAVGIERDLAGVPKAEIPSEYMAKDADENKKALYGAMKKIVTGLHRHEQAGMVIPSDRDEKGNRLFDVTLMTSSGTRQIDTDKVLDRWNRIKLMSVLAQFLMLGQSKGSFALSSDQTAMFRTALGAVLDEVCDVFNRHAFPRVMRLNGRPATLSPFLRYSGLKVVNLDALSNYILRLTQAGILFDDEQKDFLKRQIEGMPIPASETAGG